MTDREKVIRALEICNFGGAGACYEKECPYYWDHDCLDILKNKIIFMLKEQKPVLIESQPKS